MFCCNLPSLIVQNKTKKMEMVKLFGKVLGTYNRTQMVSHPPVRSLLLAHIRY